MVPVRDSGELVRRGGAHMNDIERQDIDMATARAEADAGMRFVAYLVLTALLTLGVLLGGGAWALLLH